ncbi:hypothetical protein H4R99_004267 [Coemansia sp. RSA 1722]|nr:hypothetical protein LPJ57_005739 [Coemansia sp. RSA 486]KAJ2232849.1 hypothetical protein IWW45_004645 [Coemansia sp. RSA 485]KAJ2598037.1 hypothetical protein H4R99_004267 [Coemansia sp. RSA 1722]
MGSSSSIKEKSVKDTHSSKKSKSLKKEKEKKKDKSKEKKRDKKSLKKDKSEKRGKSKDAKKKLRESTDISDSDSDQSSESGPDIELEKLSLHNRSDTGSNTDSDSDDDMGIEKETMQLDKKHEQATLKVRDLETGLQEYVATNLDLVRYKQISDQTSTDQQAQEKFKKIYMDYVTNGFGADLDTLRKEHEIDDEGLEMLIDVLETGVLAFTPADQKMIIEESA